MIHIPSLEHYSRDAFDSISVTKSKRELELYASSHRQAIKYRILIIFYNYAYWLYSIIIIFGFCRSQKKKKRSTVTGKIWVTSVG